MKCDENYFNTTCTKFCRPRNDVFGHYTCNERGDKICLHGWVGRNCDTGIIRARCLNLKKELCDKRTFRTRTPKRSMAFADNSKTQKSCYLYALSSKSQNSYYVCIVVVSFFLSVNFVVCSDLQNRMRQRAWIMRRTRRMQVMPCFQQTT